MSHLLSREKLEEQLPRLLSGINSLYRKHSSAQTFIITQVNCSYCCLGETFVSSVNYDQLSDEVVELNHV